MKMFSFFRILSILFLTQFLISCGAKNDGPASVTFKAPEQLPSQKLTSSAGLTNRSFAPGDQQDIWSPAFAPGNRNELNCFGVVIGGNSAELTTSTNTCEATDGTEFNFGRQKMGANPGDELKFEELEPGQTIIVRVLGWRAENSAACDSLKAGTNVEAKQLSHPFVLAQESITLQSGDNDVTINASFAESKELVNCNNLTPKVNSFSTRDFNIGGVVFNNKEEFIPGQNLIVNLILSRTGTQNPEAQARIIQQEIRGNGPGVFGEPEGQEGPEPVDNPIILRDGQPFEIKIAQQPSGKSCAVNNGIGVINGESFLDAQIVCEDIPFSVGGAVIGLVEDEGIYGQGQEGSGELVLGMFSFPAGEFGYFEERFLSTSQAFEVCEIDGEPIPCEEHPPLCFDEELGGFVPCQGEISPGEPTFVSLVENGSFTFDRSVLHNDNVDVFIASQPVGQNCFINNGFQTVFESDINDIQVNCSPNSFFVSGSVSGLIAGRTLQLNLDAEANDANQVITVEADGGFLFSSGVVFNTNFNVTIANQPAGMNCSITNGAGNRTMVDGGIDDISIDCTPLNFNIGGAISGIQGQRSITLRLDSGQFSETKTFNGNGTDNFEGVIASGQIFSVSVETQPVGHNCTVEPSNGTVFDSDILGIVTCTPLTFQVGGFVSNLISGRNIGVQLSAGEITQNLNLTANASYAFTSLVPSGTVYNVAITSQPAGMNCGVSNSSAEILGVNVNNVNISCTPLPFGVGGSVSGLIDGRSMQLSLNGEILLDIEGNAGFQFGETVNSGQTYTVEIAQLPPGQTCSVTNGTGTILASNITNIAVNCSPLSFNIENTVSGLLPNRSLQLSRFGIDPETEETIILETITVDTNGSANFETPVPSGQFFSVEVTLDPVGMSCGLDSESSEGTIFDQNVSISWTCDADPFLVGGTISGIVADNAVRISLAEGENILETINVVNGNFNFTTEMLSGTFYSVIVDTDAVGHSCVVNNSSGEVLGQDVDTVAVVCTPNSFDLSVQLSGLINGRSITVQNNGADSQTGTADPESGQPFLTFSNQIPFGTDFAVSISSMPAGQNCTVENSGLGGMGDADITLAVTCVPLNFTVGGAVTGLLTGRSVELQLEGQATPLTINDNTTFTFGTPIASGQDYNVSIATQPVGMNCSISNGTGTIFDQAISNVSVVCAPQSFTVGGTVVDHPADGENTLSISNSDGQTLDLLDNGAFSFALAVASGQAFDIQVTANPFGFTCLVSGGTGTVLDQNITTPVITCTENQFTIGGAVSGLDPEESVDLQLNSAEILTVTDNEGFTFVTTLTEGLPYDVTVATNPNGKTCEISNASGSINGANVTDVTVTCSAVPGIAQGIIDSSFAFGQGALTFSRTTLDNNSQIEIDSSDRLNILFNADGSMESCRHLSDGDFDSEYGDAGCVNIATVQGAVATPAAMKVDANGRQIVTGRAGTNQMFVAAFLSDGGGLDAAFNSGQGSLLTSNSCNSEFSSNDNGLSVALDAAASQNYYIGGHSSGNSSTETFSWWKVLETGTLDSTFFQNGAIPGHTCADESTVDTEQVSATIVDATGTRLISVGALDNGGQKMIKLVGLQAANSQPDTGFAGGDGVDTFDPSSADEIPNAIALDASGRIYVAGRGGVGVDGFIARYDANGVLDTTYGTNGIVFLSFGGQESINTIQIDSEGNAVVGAEDLITNNGFVSRFDPTGTLDTTFATNGTLTLTDQPVKDLAIDSLGNIYVTVDTPTADQDVVVIKIN